MKISNFKKLVGVTALGLAAVFGTSVSADAQTTRQQRQERRIQRQERIERQRAMQEAQQIRAARQRQRNNGDAGGGVIVLNNRGNNNRNRNDRLYGSSEAVRAAVNAGYQQGIIAGQRDRSRNKYNQSNVYRGTSQRPDDINQYEYNYRQGFLEGYEDGYNGRRQY